MKVVHVVSGSLIGGGGATRGAYWIHLALLDYGIDSLFFTNSRNTLGDERVISAEISNLDKILSELRKKSDELPLLLYPERPNTPYSPGLFGLDLSKIKLIKDADIVHLHWINNAFVDVSKLWKVKTPIIWTIRDMWPMTGGCHYSFDCTKYKLECGSCPQLNSDSKHDISRWILNRKVKKLHSSIKVVGISNWLSEQAQESLIFKGNDIKTIHNGINTSEFFPINKELARKTLGINTNKKIILVGATNNTSPYKGFDKFINALTYLDHTKYYLCFFGQLEKAILEKLDFEYKHFGFLYDSLSMRVLYSAAHVFVAPSIAEAFGKTLVESMACETPVVCFDATGPKDIVSHGIDGYKATPFESKQLSDGVEWIVDSSNYIDLCKNARLKAQKKFDTKIIALKYIQLYEESLA